MSFDFSVKMAGVWPSFSDGYRLRNPKDSLILPTVIATYSTVNSTIYMYVATLFFLFSFSIE